MRVLWLSPFAGDEASSGTGGWVSALAATLRNRSTVELSIAAPSPKARIARRTEADGHVHYDLPLARRPSSGTSRVVERHLSRLDEVVARDLLEVVHQARPDLVHVFGTESGLATVQELVARPTLISLQGNLTACLECFFGGLRPLDVVRHGQKRRLLAGTSLLHRYRRYVRAAARERKILREARYVTGRTAWDREIAGRLAPGAAYFHCDEVVREPFRALPARQGPSSEPSEILTTIRSNPYKGLDTLLQAAHGLSASGVAFNWRVAGIRPDEEIAAVCRRKFGMGFRENSVHLLGSQSAESLTELLAQADYYVHPTWIDNSPNALCEAMLAGLPIVTTHVGGIPSLLTPNREGLTVPAGNVEAMIRALQELRSKPERARRLADNARRRAELRHDPERISGALTDIYARILDESIQRDSRGGLQP